MVRLILGMGFMGLAVLLAGCQTAGVSPVSTKDFSQSSSLPEAKRVAELAIGDTIEVSVEVDGRMEVTRHRVKLDQHGAVTLPLVGDVRVKGMKPDAARKSIYNAYASYYVHPPVVMFSTVEDLDAGEFGFVTVTGRVGTPGLVMVNAASGVKLTYVIQQSGGFASSAKSTGILVSRIDENGEKIQVTVNYNDIGQAGNIDADILLKDGDVVYVPERVF